MVFPNVVFVLGLASALIGSLAIQRVRQGIGTVDERKGELTPLALLLASEAAAAR